MLQIFVKFFKVQVNTRAEIYIETAVHTLPTYTHAHTRCSGDLPFFLF